MPIFFQVDFLNPIENTLEDFQITDIYFSQIQDVDNIPVDSSIVLINIGDLERHHIARQLEIVNQYNPKVIGIDAFFREEKEPYLDDPLEKALSEIDNLVLVTKIVHYNAETDTHDSVETSHDRFNQWAFNGYANFITAEDNFRTVRTFTPKEKLHDSVQYSFAVEVAQKVAPDKVKILIERNNRQEIINFRRNTDKYITLGVIDVFKNQDSLHFIEDKIVLFGFMGPDVISPTDGDIFFTSLNENFVGKSYPDMYAVVVHANIISMIMDETYFASAPEFVSNILTIAMIYLVMAMFTFLREKHESWYEAVSFLGTFVLLVFIFLLILGMFSIFKVDLKAAGVFFAVILLKQIYETYNDSIKVLVINFFKRKFPEKFNKGVV